MKVIKLVNGTSLNYYTDYIWDRSIYMAVGFYISYKSTKNDDNIFAK